MNNQTPNLQRKEIFNHLPYGCMTVNTDGMIVDANEKLLNYSGYNRKELINLLKIDDLLSSQSLLRIKENLPILNLYGFKNNINLSLKTKKGTFLTCSSDSIVIKDNLSNPKFYQHTFIDIREKEALTKTILELTKRAEKAEYKLKKITSELLNINMGLANEIQNPLRNILGLITLLQKNHSQSFTITGQQFLSFVEESGEQIRKHLSGILKSPTSGKGIIDKEYINLNVVLNDVKVQLSEVIIKYNVNIEIPVDLPAVFGVSHDLNLLFYNLLKNAIQFKNEKTLPHVIIKYDEDDSLYHFTIEDNGSGIADEYHNQIFEEYFKISPASEDCAGMGLTESRQIVENHKGTIGVISSAGKGCTIYFSLEK